MDGGRFGEKLHYNAYEMGVFWRNCIIVQFLDGQESKEKCIQRGDAEYTEKRFESSEMEARPGLPEV